MTDRTLYHEDFVPQTEQRDLLRQILDDRVEVKRIHQTAKKPHVDMEKQAPTMRSTNKALYPAVEIRDILIEAQPHLPLYRQRLTDVTSSGHANDQMTKSMQHFKRRNIELTRTTRNENQKETAPYCPRGRGFYSTEKRSHDGFLHESMINPQTRKSIL